MSKLLNKDEVFDFLWNSITEPNLLLINNNIEESFVDRVYNNLFDKLNDSVCSFIINCNRFNLGKLNV